MNQPSHPDHSSANKRLVSISAGVMITAACLWVVGRLVLTMQIYGFVDSRMSKEDAVERLMFLQTMLRVVDIVSVSLFLIGGAAILYAYRKGKK